VEIYAYPILDEKGEVKAVVEHGRDVSERMHMIETIRESEEKYRMLVESAQEGIWVIDKDALTTFVNPFMADMFGYTADEMQGKHLFSFMDERGGEIARKYLENREKGIFEQHDFEFIRKDGNRIYTSLQTNPIFDINGVYIGALACVANITERKLNEEQIANSLKEKEVLLKEIHHRVKNNMAIVSSLLHLQSKYVKDKDLNRILNESRNRIASMALVHEKLYQTEEFVNISFKGYIEELAGHLLHTYGKEEDDISLALSIDDLRFNIDTMIPFGLILNELMTNSLKYAFEGVERPEISISTKMHDGNVTLVYSDNGMGVPEHIDFANSQTLGLQLVNMLMLQLKGKVELDKERRTEFTLKLKIPE
jgi:PAS domain S-box-containing protein